MIQTKANCRQQILDTISEYYVVTQWGPTPANLYSTVLIRPFPLSVTRIDTRERGQNLAATKANRKRNGPIDENVTIAFCRTIPLGD